MASAREECNQIRRQTTFEVLTSAVQLINPRSTTRVDAFPADKNNTCFFTLIVRSLISETAHFHVATLANYESVFRLTSERREEMGSWPAIEFIVCAVGM